eukprot:2313632-Prymnesium_polylepis.1
MLCVTRAAVPSVRATMALGRSTTSTAAPGSGSTPVRKRMIARSCSDRCHAASDWHRAKQAMGASAVGIWRAGVWRAGVACCRDGLPCGVLACGVLAWRAGVWRAAV